MEVPMKRDTPQINNRILFLLFGFLTTFLVSIPAWGKRIDVQVDAGQSYVLAESKQTIPIKISLTGFSLPPHTDRAPVNVAIVIDKSGSMGGEKIQHARQAAVTALQQLRETDIVSVVTYDDRVEVVVPATKLSDRTEVIRKINTIGSGGSTALFAGVSKGSQELHKFLSREQVNRVVLLSDGIANVGPSSPGELGRLGMSLAQDGISVTTLGLGLGYNEDLMTELANRSDGNHAFVRHPHQLAGIFTREFGDILSVVAQDLEITIHCAEGIRPVRVLGREASIYGQKVVTSLNQLYANQEKYIVLEVEVPAGTAGITKNIASVNVLYSNLSTRLQDSLSRTVGVTYSHSREQVEKNMNRAALESYYDQLANSISEKAVVLRDKGDKPGAQNLLRQESQKLRSNAKKYKIPLLEKRAKQYEQEAKDLDTTDWNVQRKGMRSDQFNILNQQSSY
jgi:Ca-activated chloride channel family protein